MLTSTLYVDFGDRFPAAGLAGTIGTLRTATSGVAGDPAVAGPNMDKDLNGDFGGAATDDEDAFNIASFVSRYTADGGAYPGGLTQLRADIMTYVRRFYSPYDIDVIELTANVVNVNGRNVRGAASLADISSTLGANEAGVAKNNDSYVLLGNMIVHRPAGDGGDVDIANFWGGYASTIDMPNSNNNDNSAIGFVGIGDFSGGINAGYWGNLISHEAGHTFGFQHSLTQAPGGNVSPLIPTSEIMSYRGSNGFEFFSRYPMVRGNNNTTNNEDLMAASPPAPAANRTPYDQWVNTPSIGQNNAFNYITGTGANDIITVARNGNQANVSVQAFSDAAYLTALNVPGSGGASTTYSYTLSLDRPIIVDGGDLDDRIVLDADLGVTVTVRGMSGSDEVIVNGKNAASATYTPGTNAANGLDGNPDLRGAINVGSTTINFQEFETTSFVTVRNVATVTLVTPSSVDDLQVTSPAGTQSQVGGSSGGVTLVPLRITGVANLVVNTATNDGGGIGADLVEVTITSGPSASLVISTGAGGDTVTVNDAGAGFPVPVQVNGGTGTDLVEVNGSPIAGDNFAVGANGARVAFARTGPGPFSLDIGTVETLTVNGFGGADVFGVGSLAGVADLTVVNLNGFDDSDTFNVTPAATVSVNINGGPPFPHITPGDTLNVNLAGTANPTLAAISTPLGFQGSYTFGNRMPVNFQQIETLLPLANLAVTKTDSPDPVVAGTRLTYSITLTNTGPVGSQNVSLSDALPAGTTFVSATEPAGWIRIGPALGGTGTVTFANPAFATGASASFTIVVLVNANVLAGTTITNSATVSSGTPDSNPSNDTGTATTRVITSADLAVTKVASPSPATAGSPVTYTLTLTNNGPSDARNVNLSDAVPAGTTFLSAAAPSGWNATRLPVGATGNVKFFRDSFAAGASLTFTVVVQVAATGVSNVTNTATVSSTTNDPNPGNNSFTTNTPVTGPAELVVTRTVSPGPVTPGANLTYTVTVQNVGASPALNVTLQEFLSASTSFVSNSGAPGWASSNPPVGSFGGVVTITTPSFAPGATSTFTIIVKVPDRTPAGTVLTDRALVSSSSTEANPHNNTTTGQVIVGLPPGGPPPGGPGAAALAATASAAKPNSAPISLTTVQDQVLATSGGLVADLLRQRKLSG